MKLSQWALAFLLFSVCVVAWGQRPIIDVHGHILPVDASDTDPASPANHEFRQRFADTLAKHNVRKWVGSGPEAFLDAFKKDLGDRMIPGSNFPCSNRGTAPNVGINTKCFESGLQWPPVDWLEAQFRSGRYQVMGEMIGQYFGFAPDAPELLPYYRLADRLDVPVAIHANGGPPSTANRCCPEFRLSNGDPMDLEEILVRFPDLRIHLMHVGDSGFLDRAVGLLVQYPHVMFDVTPFQEILPEPAFHAMLQQLLLRVPNATNRLMFGTDHGPKQYSRSVGAFESAPFLSDQEKDAIFCGNAQRWLGLDESICKPE